MRTCTGALGAGILLWAVAAWSAPTPASLPQARSVMIKPGKKAAPPQAKPVSTGKQEAYSAFEEDSVSTGQSAPQRGGAEAGPAAGSQRALQLLGE